MRSVLPLVPFKTLCLTLAVSATLSLVPAGALAQDCPLTQLTSTSGGVTDWASVNPFGLRVAFHSTGDPAAGGNADGSFEIYLYDLETSFLRQVTSQPDGVSSFDPSLSTHGTRIAFLSSADLTGGNADGSFEVYRYDAFTELTTRITGGFGGSLSAPSISGDGQRIAFASNRDEVPGGQPRSQR